MPTLQKFKLLATQCAVSGSPTRSPTASPVIHLRRRKTLRMLLGRGGDGAIRDEGTTDRGGGGRSPRKGKQLPVRRKLKDLFVSSPPAFGDRASENVREGLLQQSGGGQRVLGRSLSATFRQRLLRRAWRPVLVGIPE